jgi:hypothetical protein
LTANGEVVLAPAYNNSFVVHNPQLPEEESWRTIGPISFATSGVRMGGCTTSSADPNTVYSVPFNHNRILAVNLVDGSVQQFGSFLEAGRNLYQGVIETGEYLFGIPYSSNDILIIDPLNTNPSQRATTLSLQSPYRGNAMWKGGIFSPSTGKIYCAPYNATSILVIVPGEFPENTNYQTIDIDLQYMTTYIDQNGDEIPIAGKWNHGAIGADGKIYFAPYNESTILVLDPLTESFETIQINSSVGAKYSDILLTPSNTLMLIPYRERSFLELDITTKKFNAFGDYGVTFNTFSAAVFLPQQRVIMAFPNYLRGIEKMLVRDQHLFYYKNGTFTKGVASVPRFRMTPKVHPEQESIIFHDLSTMARLDTPATTVSTKGVAFSSPLLPGVLGWSKDEDDEWVATSSIDDTFSVILPSQGGMCGVKSFSANCDLSVGILDNVTFSCRTGDTQMEIPNIFKGTYRDGQHGVLGMYSDATRMFTSYDDVSLSREEYNVVGDSGSTFSIGRIFGRQYKEINTPETSSTVVGHLSEVLVFKSDVRDKSIEFGADQNLYFKETRNTVFK